MTAPLDLGVHALLGAYRDGTLTVRQTIEEVLKRIAQAGDDKVWISRAPDADLLAQADALDARRGEIGRLPLFGVPFAAKDNLDVAGMVTTAACPGFAYEAKTSAEVVQRLVDAGAIVIGKTNLDQFATGLVGVRSPYGVPRNPFDASYVPGGSSSGSAVAVSSGLVSFSLGTDTAGSGRVPAGFNNIVGLKPTPGLLSNEGMVPACRSLDCTSVFALSCADADAVLAVAAEPHTTPAIGKSFRFGILGTKDAEFFGDAAYATLYAQSIERLKALGGTPVEIDYAPFRDAAQLLYSGPWVAERTAAVGAFMESADDKSGVWPTTQQIVLGGRKYSAVDAFEGQYRLAELKARAFAEMKGLDFLAVPTAGTIYKLSDLEREPVLYNSHLGHYTNFVNFFGLSALAVPAGFRPDGMPFGITLIANANAERALLAFGARWQRAVPLPLGKTTSQLPPPERDPVVVEDRVPVAVVGAHMSGLPLNGQLLALGGRLEKAARTAPVYRFYALPGGPPHRPGLVRVAEGGGEIELEVWSLPAEKIGALLRQIPAPLGLGSVSLADGTSVPGFLCEAHATTAAKDITSLGGWRAYVKTLG
ncbi:allophanate hydrolase [Reyranella aquatilis]|uniref:Allophanate hydrolase n=1 Tax=Reyranella aquatilis TaxID=2035356 RepID=A0ABS8L375_9HYPH|nr:allophanate hydrolase [Reyranella aquatilis]MCC8432756.1 allophanate hydrolase [Reyranella aquatilis]